MTYKTSRIIITAILLLAMNARAYAGPSWQSGTISDHTSVLGGLLIRFDPGVALPDNCATSPSPWLFIAETNKAMMAVTLMAIAMNNRVMDVYTKGIGPSGYCEVVQVDPAH
jgi:hypothetical protein